MFRLLVCATFCLAACREQPRPTLTPQAQQVLIITDTPQGCQALGDAGTRASADDPGRSVYDARIQLRNNAGRIGATHVTLQTNSTIRESQDAYTTTMFGVAYRCSPAPAPAPVATPAPAPTQPLPPGPPPGSLPPVG